MEIQQGRDRDERQKSELLYKEMRTLMANMYKDICTRDTDLHLPSQTGFYNLPVVSEVLGHFKGPGEIDDKFRAATLLMENIGPRLEKDLITWLAKRAVVFVRLMGLQNEQIDGKSLNVLNAVTARFNCSSCFDYALKIYEAVSLDFGQACRHECKGPLKKSPVYEGKGFVLDEKVRRLHFYHEVRL